MRLRRLELVIIGATLAFACFIGGYFTGRSANTVSVVPMAAQQSETLRMPATSVPTASSTEADPSAKSAAEEDPETESPEIPAGSVIQPQEATGAPRESDGRININSATRSELMDLPGIGSVLSERIVEYRKINGSFSKIEDLRKVSGIGEKRFEAVKDRITVG